MLDQVNGVYFSWRRWRTHY